MGSPSRSLQRHIHQKAHHCSHVKTRFSAHLQTSTRCLKWGVHISPIHKNSPFFQYHFCIFFFEILFRFSHFSFLSRHVCGFGHDVWVWLGNRGGNITPTWCLFHLLYFSEQMGTKQEEGRGLLTDNLIGMSLEDWKSPAREICCSNIKQQVRAEAAETLLSVERICQQKL